MARNARILMTLVTLAVVVPVSACLAQTDFQPAYEPVLNVAVDSAVASDSNPGSEAAPLLSLNEGLRRALVNRERAIATTIRVHPGTYRESLTGYYANSAGSPITIEAVEPGAAIVSGSDVWRDWSCARTVCTHEWPFKWGFARNPWPNISIEPIALRREMVFVDDVAMTQVTDLDDVLSTPGTFFVDESTEWLHLNVLPGTDPASMTVEVAMRPTLVRLQALHDLTIRGLVFQHANTPLPGTAVDIVDQRNVLIEDVLVQWNNFDGLGFKGEGFVVRRSTMNDNGGNGVSAYQAIGLLMEGTESSRNNWRGSAGGLFGWAVGQKIMESRDVTVHGHRSMDNLSFGLWIDWDNSNIVVRDLWSCRNLQDGLFVEINQGPVSITDSVLCDNTRAGLRTSATRNLELRGNEIRGNAESQLVISGDLDVSIVDRISGEAYVLNNTGWSVVENDLSSDGDAWLISNTVPSPYWQALMQSSSFYGNSYTHGSRSTAFQGPNGTALDFAAWQEASGQDSDSRFNGE